jgi:hypothetical protein
MEGHAIMATKAQIAANRRNAKRSTGPKTPEGKAVVAQNATTHGFTSKHLIVPESERDEFAALEAELLAEIRPKGALEAISFRQLVHAAWNQNRYFRTQVRCIEKSTNPLNARDPGSFAVMERLHRYQAQMQRAYTRALAELRKLQTERALREQLSGPHPATELSVLVDLAKLTRFAKRTQSAPRKWPPEPPATDISPGIRPNDAENSMQPAA